MPGSIDAGKVSRPAPDDNDHAITARTANVIALPTAHKRPASRLPRAPLPLNRIAAHLAETVHDLDMAALWLLDADVHDLKRRDPAYGRELELAVAHLHTGYCDLRALVERLGGPVPS